MRFTTLLAASVIAITASTASGQESGIAVGAQAPGAKVQTLAGKPIDMGSYVGKGPMLIEFWAFWCPNCRELEPSLVALHKKYGTRVRFLSVAVSVNETLDRVKTYTAKKGYKHETVYDGYGEATEAYDVPATSYVVVLDKSGKVVYTGLGGKQQLEPAILKALQ
ncbi:MAG TPA: redoxin family protein [Gemmatimonadaceae bacterium]